MDTATTTKYSVEFERIGRRRDVPDNIFTVVDADDLAQQVWRFAGRYLGSRWYDVTVDLDAMTGSIEAGRFGRFFLREVTA